MQKNATIEEVRKIRQEISRKYEYDPKKLVQFYMDRQKTRISTSSHTEPRVRGPLI
jgi:translation initiation factor 2 beta subunit (eIF-2beta)/eIF-5